MMTDPKPKLDRSKTGRAKGTPNKTTALLKDAILQAAQQAGGKDGLIGYLTQQAKENPGPFLSLLGKVLPLQVTGPNDGPIQTQEVSPRDKLFDIIDSLSARERASENQGKLN